MNLFMKYCEKELKSCKEIIELEQINKNLIRDYLSELNRKYKAKTVKRKIAVLKGFFSFLIEMDYIVDNPFWRVKIKIKEPYVLPITMSLKEVRKLLRTAYNCPSGAKKGKAESVLELLHLRDIAVLEMLFATGLRVHELCGLTYKTYNTKKKSIDIIGKGQRERKLFLGNSEAVKAVEQYLEYKHRLGFTGEYIFINKWGQPLSCQAVRNIVTKYCKLAKIDKNITPHVFRHSFASLLLEEGVDIKYIQEFLGHSSISTTQIYLHISEKKARNILENKHPRKNLIVKNQSSK